MPSVTQDWDAALNKYVKKDGYFKATTLLNQAATSCFGLCWKKKAWKKTSTPAFSYWVQK